MSLEVVLRQDGAEPLVEYVLALRFRPTLALVLSGGRPLTLRAADARTVGVRGHDALKGLTVLNVPPPAADWQPVAIGAASGPQYLLVAEAVAGGLAMRPLIGAQAGTLASPHWDGPLVALGRQVQAALGSLVFALDGSLVVDRSANGDVTLRAELPCGS